jgi:protein ImuB
VLERLIGDVAESLARRGAGAVQLDCRLEPDGGAPVVVPVRLVRATASARHLLELIRLQLERLQLSGSISAVRVRVVSGAVLEHDQFELFDSGTDPQAPRELAALVDRLSTRLGRESVARVRLVPDAQPEATFRYEPLIGANGTIRNGSGKRQPRVARSRRPNPVVVPVVQKPASHRDKSDGAGPVAPSLAHRAGGSALARRVGVLSESREGDGRFSLHTAPLRLSPRPEPITVVSAVPDGPPARFDWAGEWHRIVRAVGPERIETGWWRGRPVPARRDYYRVETDAGRRFWLFRRLDDGRWFLHGWFD